LSHKIIEIIRASPRFISEYLQVDYEQRTADRWSKLIFR
jgi:hypothetical protein